MDTNKHASKSGAPLEDKQGNLKKVKGVEAIWIHDEVVHKTSYHYVNAKEACDRARKLEEDYRSEVENLTESSPHNLAPPIKKKELNRRVHKEASLAVASAAFAVEAMINYYGQQRIPKYFSSNERKPTKNKVREFPEQVLMSCLQKFLDPLLERVEWLIHHNRNALVHPKTDTADPTEVKADYMLGFEDAEKALKNVEELYDKLKELDSEFDLDFDTHVDDDEIQGEYRMPLS